MAEDRYSAILTESVGSVDYWAESAILDFTEEISRLMEEKQVTRAELARRINSSQAYITKVLRGNVNFTLTTMTKLARALGVIVHIHLAPEGVLVTWRDDSQYTTATTDTVFAEPGAEHLYVIHDYIPRAA